MASPPKSGADGRALCSCVFGLCVLESAFRWFFGWSHCLAISPSFGKPNHITLSPKRRSYLPCASWQAMVKAGVETHSQGAQGWRPEGQRSWQRFAVFRCHCLVVIGGLQDHHHHGGPPCFRAQHHLQCGSSGFKIPFHGKRRT